jgi:hypothetical protein
MIKKLFVWIAFFTLTTVTVHGQTNKRLYEIYEFGAWFDPGDSCVIEIRKKYGFKTISGGCTATSRMAKHNDKAEKLLLQRNGPKWRTKYSDEIIKCNRNTIVLKTTLEPLVFVQPTSKSETITPDSMDFKVIVFSDSIVIKYHNASFNTTTEKMNEFIIKQEIAKINPKIFLETSAQTPIEKIEAIIKVFTDNNLNNFILITR